MASSSNFPNGFNAVQIRGVPIVQSHPGRVFWVSNSTVTLVGQVGGSDGNRGTFDAPFGTLDFAIGQCTADRGDIIFIKPGHAENIDSATALAMDVAGIAIIGLGAGTKRPTFTLTTANTATINVSAANMSVSNIKFVGNFLSIASCFTIGAAPEFTIDNCDFSDTSAVLGFLTAVTTTVTVNADNFTYTNNKRVSVATTSPGPDIVIAGTMLGLTVNDNKTYHLVASNNIAALIEHGALVMTAMSVRGNHVFSVNTDTATGAVLVKTTATTGSGIISHNRIRALDIAAAIIVTAAAVNYGMFDNLYTGETTQLSGFVLPAIATDA